MARSGGKWAISGTFLLASLSAETSTKLGLIARDSRTPFSWEGKGTRYQRGLGGDLHSGATLREEVENVGRSFEKDEIS